MTFPWAAGSWAGAGTRANWPNGATCVAADLDPVSDGKPVWLLHTMGHYGVADSEALELAGIDRDTPDPPGGTIDRDADGKPTGVLKEAAMDLVARHVPAADAAQLRDGIRLMSQEFNRECMTGAKDPGIEMETWNRVSRRPGGG